MNIKSLLLGSAAALAVVSGAQAADAIVAAEPEPMEYVRVCDAFGTGYFYIPGTETCLKIGGEVRFAYDWNTSDTVAARNADDFQTRARLVIESKNDSEVGTIGSYIRLQGTSDGSQGVTLDQAYITVGGFKAGYFLTWADDIGISGENDTFIDNAKFDSVSYTYSADAFTVGLGVDELRQADGAFGIQGLASTTLGAVTLTLWGGYDTKADEGYVVGKGAAAIGPGTFELYAGWASDPSAYVGTVEWTVGAAYGFKATEKLTITPSVNFVEQFNNVDYVTGGVLASYAVASGLKVDTTVDYNKADSGEWTGFVRLIRSF
ncbi:MULTISPECIES: porin [unclassified Agrobacterium]|uniref:porin n=1 Tax=unclassified Agrobacterium TaxID=2632611 RepID=UPI00083D22F1|nr:MULTISPECIES: porin [unclassified Agrobacterium]AOG11251.1 porin subfamily protein [Agrobacterium sp. RAC06]QGG89948.1 porin [Agrobacterium sp. MA01]